MNQGAIEKQLDKYLIKDYLTSLEAFQALQDPFPKWEFK